MATQSVTYLTKAFLSCSACPPVDVIIWLEPGTANPFICPPLPVGTPSALSTIEGQVTAVIQRGTSYEYTLSYDDEDITTPTLDPATILGVACVGPLAAYIQDLAGTDPYVTSNDDGTYTFHSNHGCEYIFRGVGVDNLIVTDTDSVDLSLTAEFGLQAYVRISGDLGNSLEVRGGGLYATSGWSILGNEATIDGTNFLGTIDNVPFTIRANNKQVFRAVPNAASPNLILGFEGNAISLSEGATISGGGFATNINQIASSNYATISGGLANSIQSSFAGTIGGGGGNIIQASSQYSVIGGGSLNVIAGDYSTIGGGKQNSFSGAIQYGFIGGGVDNLVSGTYSIVVGGTTNRIVGAASGAFIGGGVSNYIGLGNESIILGGNSNVLYGFRSIILGGFNNAVGTLIDDADYSIIVGGESNNIASGSNHSVIGGGQNNKIQTTGVSHMTIAGGANNLVEAACGAIGGGSDNIISSRYGAIAGGFQNHISASADFATIGGGIQNAITMTPGLLSGYSLIAGGSGHLIINSAWGAIAGGQQNEITGIVGSTFGFIGGGFDHCVDNAPYGSIVGGNHNEIHSGSQGSFIGSGGNNYIGVNNITSTIVNGEANRIEDQSGGHNFIGSGETNVITNVNNSVIVGGKENTIIHAVGMSGHGYSSIVGGLRNHSTNSDTSFIGAGQDNIIATSYGAIIVGGEGNTITNIERGIILGGKYNHIFADDEMTQGQGSTIIGGSNLALGHDSVGYQSPKHITGGYNGWWTNLSQQSNLIYFGDADLWLANTTQDVANNTGLRLYGNIQAPIPFPRTFTSPFVEYVKHRAGSPNQSYSITWPDNPAANFISQYLRTQSVTILNGIPNVQLEWVDAVFI